eukprot:8900893-Pyramimonas_sp.AAC.1
MSMRAGPAQAAPTSPTALSKQLTASVRVGTAAQTGAAACPCDAEDFDSAAAAGAPDKSGPP